jgi:dTDP-4-dehydrorhamnose reductase
MSKVFITGASGMVGFWVCKGAIYQNHKVVGIGRTNRHSLEGMEFKEVDLTDTHNLTNTLKSCEPDLIIHLAANTNQKACKENSQATWDLHVESSALLASFARKKDAKLIYISTEAVYGYFNNSLRNELDICSPIGCYATTKYHAEDAILKECPQALILRVTPVGVTPKTNQSSLVEWIVKTLESGLIINGYQDVFFTPISSKMLADLILNRFAQQLYGIYNWGIRESISKYDFAMLIAKSLGYPKHSVIPTCKSVNGNIYQGGMDSTKLSIALGSQPPTSGDLMSDLSLMIKGV